jgi:hypothetical protein
VQGLQGAQGLKGDKGDPGAQGLKGDKGDAGYSEGYSNVFGPASWSTLTGNTYDAPSFVITGLQAGTYLVDATIEVTASGAGRGFARARLGTTGHRFTTVVSSSAGEDNPDQLHVTGSVTVGSDGRLEIYCEKTATSTGNKPMTMTLDGAVVNATRVNRVVSSGA